MHASDLNLTDFAERINSDGFAIVPTAIDDEQLLEQVAAELATDGGGDANRRDVFAASPAAVQLAHCDAVRRLACAVLGNECFAVRALLFDKTEEANWKVAWHQDLTIVVRERRDVSGYGPWSVKAGLVHVQPPVDVLRRMLAVRVHLDDCDAENGPVRVLPGSHADGRLSNEHIECWKDRVAAVDCCAPRGGVLAFRPLILHASSPAIVPRRRRVVHFEFAAGDLAGGLEWQARV